MTIVIPKADLEQLKVDIDKIDNAIIAAELENIPALFRGSVAKIADAIQDALLDAIFTKLESMTEPPAPT